MWVLLPTIVFVSLISVENAAGQLAPNVVASSVASAEDQGRNKDNDPVISLEYKPIRPSYLSSGSNVAQIVPPGEPWPASPEGYANFSQLGAAPIKNAVSEDVPPVQSAPTSSNMINLDLSNPSTNLAEALEKVLAPKLSNVKIQEQPQTITASINITPPPNADMDFVKELQSAARTAVGELAPFAGTSLQIAITKSSSGVIVNVKAQLNITVPAAVKKTTPTLPPSNVPEIDLTKGTSDLAKNLQSILSKELQQAGYNADSESEQDFSLSFSVLPPEGADKEFVKLYVLAPLQTVLKTLAPRAAITAVSVNTQESNNKILRQTVKLNIHVKPPSVPQVTNKVIEVPEVDLNAPGINIENTVIGTLQDQMRKIATLDPAQAKTLSIPFKISPPAGATKEEIQENYIIPISQILSKLDPTGKILSISEKTLPNGDIILTIYMNIPANATSNPATATSAPEASTTSVQTISQVPSINNRYSIQEDEDQMPSISETSKATLTPTVDLSQKYSSLKALKNILNDELSPLSNPPEDNQPKVLAIPFKMRPTPGTTIKQVEDNVVDPLTRLLTTLEPSGKFLNSQTKSLPDGEVETVIFFLIPSVENSKTYRDLSETNPSTTAAQPSTVEFTTSVSTTGSSAPEASTTSVQTSSQVPSINNRYSIQEDEDQMPSISETSNATLTPTVDLSQKESSLKSLQKILNDELSPLSNPPEDNQPKVLAIPFKMKPTPGTTIKQVEDNVVDPLTRLLTTLEPTGKFLNSQTKSLPDGEVETVISFLIPSVENSKTYRDLSETNPSTTAAQPSTVESTTSASTTGSSITPSTKPEVPPEQNSIKTPPINLSHPNFDKLKEGIERRLQDVIKNNPTATEEPQIVSFPFMVTKDQAKNIPVMAQVISTLLKGLVPSGKPLPTIAPKVQPNGNVEFVIDYEIPSLSKIGEGVAPPPVEKKPSENTPTTELSKRNQESRSLLTTGKPETETSESTIPVIVKPIEVNKPDLDDVQKKIRKFIDDVEKAKNGESKEFEIPFIIPKKIQSKVLEKSLDNILGVMLPGHLSKPTYKDLPDGKLEMLFKYKQPDNVQETEPIVLKKNPDMSEVGRKINKIVDDAKTKNGDVKKIDIPFVISKNINPPPLMEKALATLLTVKLPGKVLPKPKHIDLPNGDLEIVFTYEPPKPKKPEVEEKDVVPTESTASITTPKVTQEPSISIGKIESRSALTTVKPGVNILPVNENQNVKILKPIDLNQFDFDTIKNGVEERIDEASKSSNGQPQTLGLTFDFPSNVPYIIQVGLEKVLQTILPGQILPNPEKKTLPNGGTQLVVYYKTPATEKPQKETTEPLETVEDVNLDERGTTVTGEVGKALTEAISTISANQENLNRPANLKFNIYAPLDNTQSKNKELVGSVSKELLKIEPTAKITRAEVNPQPSKTEPDGVVEITIPSISSSRTTQNLNNALKIPIIDVNVPEQKLVDNMKSLLQRGLQTAGQVNPAGSQLFDLNFRLNPFDTKGSVTAVLKALKSVDPTGEVASYKIYTKPDGLEYLNIIYLVPNLQDSILFRKLIPQQPEIVYESVVNIDTKNPLNGLLEKVISEISAAEDEVKGAQLEQLVDLPLDFKFTNSKGLPDSVVSTVISQTLPHIQGYVSQILPEGKVLSVNTVELPDSDDVILKIIVRAPYEPDNTIVIEEQRPRKVVTTTTPKPKSRGIFGFLGR